MPVVRIDDQGVEIDKAAALKRKARAKRAGAVVIAGMLGASVVFAQGSSDLGIFVALWSTALGSLLNLYAE